MITSAVFLVNKDCNQRCNFCLNSWKYKNHIKELSPKQKKRVIDELHNNGITSITLSGGEPLLDKSLFVLMDYASSKGMRIKLQTNGVMITKKMLNHLKKMDSVLVSLEGTKGVHNKITGTNNFEKAVGNIKLLKDNGINVSTNFTITNDNIKNIKSYLQLTKKLGVKANFTRLYQSGCGRSNYKELNPSLNDFEIFLKELSKSKQPIHLLGPVPVCMLRKVNFKHSFATCAAGKTEIAINPNGDILPCPSWPFAVGNILKNDFKEVITNLEKATERSGCIDCSDFSICGGGCLVSRLFNGNDLFAAVGKNKLGGRGGLGETSCRTLTPAHARKNSNYSDTVSDANIYKATNTI